MTPQSDIDMDLRPRMVRVEHDLTDHHRRITDMEKWRQKSEIDDARSEERFKNMESKLNKIDANLSRLMWIFLGGVIAGIVTFMMKGGFNLPN